LLLIGPAVTTPAYGTVLRSVVEATDRVEAVHVVMTVRGREGEDFSFVDPDGTPLRVEAWVELPRGPGESGRARLEKADRIYLFGPEETIAYHPERGEAYRGSGGSIDPELFWPAAWVRELQNRPTDDVELLEHEESQGLGRMVLRERGQDPGRRRPAFLGEFDRETEVEWDLATQRLTGLRRFVWVDGERVLFSETESIDYPASIDPDVFRLDLPPDVRWGGVRQAPIEVLELGPREVTWQLFESAARGDRDGVEVYCPSPSMVDWLVDPEHRPRRIYFVGEPFRSGEYPGVYVPYKVRFGDEVREHHLALRNDNPRNRWVFDGGI
jgi:hypothetical protein